MQINKHGSFYIRNGWPTKIIDAIIQDNHIYSPNNELLAVDSIGVGRVMIKAMRYWAVVLGIATEGKDQQMSYWSDAHISDFESRLQDVNTKLEAYNVSAGLQQSETKMTLTTAAGEEKTVVFDKRELTDLGITIKNKINATFGNFGLAVTYDDKVQVLLSILNDLMEGK